MKLKLKLVDSAIFNLSKKSKIAVGEDNNYYIIKNIKSRIIMKDGKKILKTASLIKKSTNKSVFLATTAPICSKTTTYLKSKNIQIITDYTNS